MGAVGTVAGVGLGAALGAAVGEVTARLPERGSALASGAGLIAAAAIYPLSRREGGAGLALEVAVLTAAAGLLAATTLRPEWKPARRVLAAGWAAHAAFDFGRGATGDSRLPGWYPAVCAGYDVAYAGRTAV